MTARQGQALALRLQGLTYAEIGKALGVTRQCAQQMIRPSRAVRSAIADRSRGMCEQCGASGGKLDVHHRAVQDMTADTYNAESNLLLLCVGCHKNAHADPAIAERKRLTRLATPERRRLGAMKRAAQLLGITFEAYRSHREGGNRWCYFHQAWEPAGTFGKGTNSCIEGNRESVRLRQDNAYARDYYRRNAERLRAYNREWKQRRRAS